MIRRDLDKSGSKLVIGKNTIMRKVLKTRANPLDKKDPDYEFYAKFGAHKPELNTLLRELKGKVGLIFSDKAVFELLPIIQSNRVQTVAKVGVIAPCDVVVAPGPTGMDPSQIGFFHALKITTKINKGQIEILKEVNVCKEGVMVGNSEAAFLKKLNMMPFLYGMDLHSVYDNGVMLSPKVAAITP
jgi:large subunit ribosomal protein LP0